jgi:hypothetical protein
MFNLGKNWERQAGISFTERIGRDGVCILYVSEIIEIIFCTPRVPELMAHINWFNSDPRKPPKLVESPQSAYFLHTLHALHFPLRAENALNSFIK